MTVIGWIQIILFCAIIVALTPVLGGYMTRVFSGERTFLSPLMRPIEIAIYRVGGVSENSEQGWLTYTVAMLLFHVGGFLILYAVMRLQAVLPFNPAEQSAVSPDLSFNTAVSFITNTNWQNYGGESTMSYLVQMLGLTHQNFLSAATGIVLAVALIRGFRRHQHPLPLLLAVPGLALLLLGVTVAQNYSIILHSVMVTCGGLLLASAHFVNLHRDRQAGRGHVHGPQCVH